jgi:SPP1 family phage portal protein
MPSIKEILNQHADNPQKLISSLSVDTKDDRFQEEYLEEFEGERTRRIKSVGKRLNKTYKVLKKDGTPTGEQKTIYVAKLVFPFPKKIVRTAVHFLFGGKMIVSAKEDNQATQAFTDVWKKDLKMQGKLKSLARTCMIETKAALLFYPQPIKDGEDPNRTKALKLRCMLLDNESGEFYPHFNDYGDMDAFLRKYQVADIEGKIIEKVKIYTQDMIHTYRSESGSWKNEKGEKNLFGKIPVVYVEQDLPEWEEIATMIDDFENRISRLADTNDYFAEPLLKIFGEASRAPNKEEVGKVVEFPMEKDIEGKTTHGDAEYATWDQTPESIKLELETVWDGIFSMTSTPDLSFNNVKGVGTTSGVALRLMFMDALIKREDKGEIFYDALNRCISVVAAGIAGYTNVKFAGQLDSDEINVEFTDQLPDDLAEAIDTLMTATGNKPILSQESGASLSPFTRDSKEEIERIRNEEKQSAPNEPFNM